MAFRKAVTEQSTTTTEKGALSYDGSSCARLEFFSKALARDKVNATTDLRIVQICHAAWNESPQDFLRLLAHKRWCRGGAGERHVAQVAWNWLAKTHPEQIIPNLETIPFYGRYKDLISFFKQTEFFKEALDILIKQLQTDYQTYQQATSEISGSSESSEISGSSKSRQLLGSISLAAKWAPSEKRAADRAAKLAGRVVPSHYVARKLWFLIKKDSTAPHSTIMRWYRQDVLTPLRTATGVVEQLLCAQKYDQVDFSKLPSRALAIYSRKCFPAHMPDRFKSWQADVLAGKAKINTSQVDPYEIVSRLIGYWMTQHNHHSYYKAATPAEIATLESFYTDQVAKYQAQMAETGVSLGNTMVIADVSGSMYGTPLAVSISLAIWMSALNTPDFRDLFMTFHEQPKIIDLSDCTTLYQRVVRTVEAEWGGSTNLQAAFDLILERAVERNLDQSDMPKRLVIVSDMQFDTACQPNVFTNFETITAKYREAGYQMPQIVFWNVRGNTTDSPVTKDTHGTALIGGFSKSLINMLLLDEPLKTPMEMMFQTIDSPDFDRMKYVNTSGQLVSTRILR